MLKCRLIASALVLLGFSALPGPAPAADLSIGILQWHRDQRPAVGTIAVPYGTPGYSGALYQASGGGCCGGGAAALTTAPPAVAFGFYAAACQGPAVPPAAPTLLYPPAAGCVGSMAYGLANASGVLTAPPVSGTFPVALPSVCVSPAGYAPTPAGADVAASLARTAALVGGMNPLAGQVGGDAPVMSNAELTAHLRALTRCVEGLTGTVQRHDAALSLPARAPRPE